MVNKNLTKWLVILIAVAYIANLTAGILELIPDIMPIFGNLDEAVVAIIGYNMYRSGKPLG